MGALAAALLLLPLGASVTTAAEGHEAAPAAAKTRAMSGNLKVGVANIPNSTRPGRFVTSMSAILAKRPTIVMLNEVSKRTDEDLLAAAPGYALYRKPKPDTDVGGSQSMNNVVMWRADRWTKTRGGRLKLVDDDKGFLHRRKFTWDRYATWVTLRRADGAKASFISTHMPTNPAKFPRQHGNPKPELSRVEMYAQGMDILVAKVRRLSRKGPVFVGGDMNSHPTQGSWTAAAKMATAGYGYAKDRGVMYLFFQSPASYSIRSNQLDVASSHPALVTTLSVGS